MGYSAATPMKSATVRKKMWSFMQKHYRAWHEIQPSIPQETAQVLFGLGPYTKEYDWTAYLVFGDALDYRGRKNKIGFNFTSSSGALGYYGFSILRWMALQAGALRKVSQKEFGNLGESVPVMQYDSDPAWPVLVREHWDGFAPEKCDWCLVDQYGYKRMHRPWFHPDSRNGTVFVVTKILMPALPEDQVQLVDAWLVRRLQMEAGSFCPEGNGTYSIEGPTTSLYWLLGFLGDNGIPFEVEKGPQVLNAYGQRCQEVGEATIQEIERVVREELVRLTVLWEAYNV